MIKAKVITDSISTHTNQRITTFELEYPRFIHAELMTHRLFSRNSASSRAIPIERMIDLVKENTAMPIYWGKNQSGMQAKKEVDESLKLAATDTWINARNNAIHYARELQSLGLHKQIVNRVLEPFQIIKVLVTATSFDNWFNLRLHPDAQPEIQELARLMYKALLSSDPMEISSGEWHLPYIERERDEDGSLKYYITDYDTSGTETDGYGYYQYLTTEQAQKISCSLAAQVSYRKADMSIEKAISIYDKLVNSNPVHASAFEHCATPIDYLTCAYDLPKGVTSFLLDQTPCSGNFTNWIQYRQLIPNHDCKDFKGEY